MNNSASPVGPLLQAFFSEHLLTYKRVSPQTVVAYRDTFRLLLLFVRRSKGIEPAVLRVSDLDAPTILAFLDDLERQRHNSPRSRNARLAAIRSFFRLVALRDPVSVGVVTRVMAIPRKRADIRLVGYLTRPEIDALLAAPDRSQWSGRRDHALLLKFHSDSRSDPTLAQAAPGVVVLGVDGCALGMQVRKGRRRLQAEGTPKPLPAVDTGHFREVKTGVLLLPSERVETSAGRRSLVRRFLVSCLGDADTVFSHLWARLRELGWLGTHTVVVIIGDGAEWIWKRATMFPRRCEILDFWQHAVEHAWEFARLSLSVRNVTCGKSGCCCASGQPHVSLYLVQSQNGKLRQLYIPKQLEERVRKAVDDYQELQRLVEELSEQEWKLLKERKE